MPWPLGQMLLKHLFSKLEKELTIQDIYSSLLKSPNTIDPGVMISITPYTIRSLYYWVKGMTRGSLVTRSSEILNNGTRNLGMFDVPISASFYDSARQVVGNENWTTVLANHDGAKKVHTPICRPLPHWHSHNLMHLCNLSSLLYANSLNVSEGSLVSVTGYMIILLRISPK
jgi:hypothetical protein